MDIRILRYFLAVAREESISGAAQALHMTQPPLSRALMELEEELGKKLLIRGNRKITLTEEGLLLRKRAAEIIELVEKTEAEVSSAEDRITGDIYIGSGETEAMRLLAKVATDLHKTCPGIKFHLYNGNADDVTERLDRGLLDFGIILGSADIKKYDYMRLPVTDVWGLLMREDNPLAARESIRPEDLADIPLLVSRQSLFFNEMSGWLRSDFSQLNIVATYNLIYNAALMVQEGLGSAFSLDRLVNTAGSNLVFRPLSPKLELNLSVVWKKYQVFTKATQKFLQKLQEAFEADGEKAPSNIPDNKEEAK